MKYDNPAGRLLEILLKVQAYPKNASARDVWREVFELPASETLSPLMTAKLGTTMLLVQQAIDLLREDHPELADPHPGWAVQVSHAFQAHNVHSHIETFSANISTDLVANVRTAAVLLDKGSKRKTLSVEKLAEMREAIDVVLKDVLESDEMDAGLRNYVVRALRKILTAIDEYKLTGATPILESIEQAVGHVMVDPEYKNFLANAPLGQRVFNALQAAGSIVTVATGMPALTHTAQLFLR
ncbi:hypothetical protein [Comamonas suwonensis]|uniref:hypothetical protein n=1 Tax=Comamonas suwonensis TaxID=2606214 RepID=UPI00145F5C59|nr:hypothetical protein [Comamonas suwonensis]MBI1625177.1 hypothetical protein [Comamonas suwonensis]